MTADFYPLRAYCPIEQPRRKPAGAETSAGYNALMTADFYPLRALLLMVSGCVHSEQQRTIEPLVEENYAHERSGGILRHYRRAA